MARLVLPILTLAAVLVLPLFLTPGTISILTQALIMALFAVAYGLLAGQAGMLAFGHAVFFATGAFTAIHVLRAVEAGTIYLPLPAVPLVAALAGLVAGLVAGFFATLRSGIYFAMITLAISEFVHTLAPVLPEIFGGEGGLSGSRYPWIGFNFYSEIENYYLILFWVTACVGLLYLYMLTPLGRLTIALRENEKRLSFLGYNARLTRNIVFAVSSMFTAIAGSLWAMTLEYANYTILAIETSANVVLAAFIGGATSFFGPVMGALLLTGLQSVVSGYSKLWLLYQGVIFIAVMMYSPRGLLPVIQGRYAAWRSGEIGSLRMALELAIAGAVAVTLILAMERLGHGIESGDRGILFWLLVTALAAGAAVAPVRHLLRRSGMRIPSLRDRSVET